MRFELWYLIVGLVLTAIALGDSTLRRLPLTQTILFLLVGLLLGPWIGLGAIDIEPLEWSHLLERLAEVGVIVSLFGAGMKFRSPLWSRDWILPLGLASLAMVMTVAGIAAMGYFFLGLPIGPAVLLGAVLAPTDPVLASEVQIEHAADRDRVRLGLTGEAGLNDGTAFPFVMLGLGLTGLHELGAYGWKWFTIDLVWMIAGGLAIGGILGTLVGHLILYLRRHRQESVGTDDYLALGLLALSYGVALELHTYGFLAAFAAGVAIRRVEARDAIGTPNEPPGEANVHRAEGEETSADEKMHIDPAAARTGQPAATDPEQAAPFMATMMLSFVEKLERAAEVALVILLGGMLTRTTLSWHGLWFIPAVLLVLRPLAVYVTTSRMPMRPSQRRLIAWFGIRGIGSIYYLMYGINHGLSPDHATLLTAIVFTTIAVSITVHGISVTPLMTRYDDRRQRRADARSKAAEERGV
ncbi:MAG TPA: cation:proton antiporter [Tepidisphaeraceae bacterium]|nr:cation:proton antiporter [Tepidisphaeraceae bacterium]